MASSVNVSVPVAEPVAIGENVTPTLHLAPAAMLPVQVLLSIANPSLVATLAKVRGPLSRFVTVTDLAALVAPTVTAPRFRVLVENVTGALPVPMRLAICGLFPASSVNVRVPVTAPVAAGEKVKPTVQLAPPEVLVPQVLLAIANPSLAAMPVKLRAAVS
jgi:hypothetical protein